MKNQMVDLDVIDFGVTGFQKWLWELWKFTNKFWRAKKWNKKKTEEDTTQQ